MAGMHTCTHTRTHTHTHTHQTHTHTRTHTHTDTHAHTRAHTHTHTHTHTRTRTHTQGIPDGVCGGLVSVKRERDEEDPYQLREASPQTQLILHTHTLTHCTHTHTAHTLKPPPHLIVLFLPVESLVEQDLEGLTQHTALTH